MPTPRIVVAYVTAGAGHRRAAEAIAEAVRTRYPQARVECHDVLTDAPGWFRQTYASTYLFLVRHASFVWKWSYRWLDHGWLYACIQPLRRRWNLFIVRRWKEKLIHNPPDLIAVTHFLPADVLSDGKEKGWLSSKLVVVVTDYYPHRFWISREPDAVVASLPDSVEVLTRRGVASEKIHLVGIPVGRAFGQPFNRAQLQQRFGLDCGRLSVLITSGGTTVGHFERVVHAVLSLESECPQRLQLLIVCGEDEATKNRLLHRAQASPMPMRVFGFVDFMADLMAASDLVVSKAGGLTVSESLARGVPLVLYHIIPGQEQMNAEYVCRQGAAVIARRASQVGGAVRRFIQDPVHAEAMRTAARRLSHAGASETIASAVIGPLLDER